MRREGHHQRTYSSPLILSRRREGAVFACQVLQKDCRRKTKVDIMRPIDLFDCASDIGRLYAGATLSKVAGRSHAEIVAKIIEASKHCHSDVKALLNYAKAKDLPWPPTDTSQLDAIFCTLDTWFRSGDPAQEIYWRTGTALAFCLWVKVPDDGVAPLRTNLNELKLDSSEIDEVLDKLSNDDVRIRLEGVENIRTTLRTARPLLPTEEKHDDSIAAIANELIYLRPNIFGVGLDVNAIIKRLRHRK